MRVLTIVLFFVLVGGVFTSQAETVSSCNQKYQNGTQLLEQAWVALDCEKFRVNSFVYCSHLAEAKDGFKYLYDECIKDTLYEQWKKTQKNDRFSVK